MKILIVALKDQAGSGQRFAEALREGGIDATMVCHKPHQNGYHQDVLLKGGSQVRLSAIKELMRGVDVLHFKGDNLPRTNALRLYDEVAATSRVITFGGSGFRRHSPDLPPASVLNWYPIQKYRDRVGAMSALTPDLMYDSDISLVPHAYPQMGYRWKAGADHIIGHSPSNRAKKGTDVFLGAMEILRQRGHPIRTKIIEGLSHDECVKEKASCHVFFDQAHVPAYGVSAVEAMMMGIPVVTRMTEEVKQKDSMYKESPVGFFEEPTPLEAANALEGVMLSGVREVSERTFEWAQRMHSYGAVFPRLVELYRSGLKKPLRRSSR